MAKRLTAKRAKEILEVAKLEGVKSGALEINGERFEFNYTTAAIKPENEWDRVLDAD